MSISIVVPVYNAQATIERAILSARDAGDFELICVDDGSQDESALKIEALSSTVPHLRMVRHPRNRGSGAARNTGLTHTTRKWVTFLDADDLISRRLDVNKLLEPLEISNPDLMLCLHEVEGRRDSPVDYGLCKGRLTYRDLSDLARAYLSDPRGNSIVSHCWGKVYKTEFLQRRNIRFREDLPIYEDTEFVARCVANAEHAYFSEAILYEHTLSRGLSRTFATAPLGFCHALAHFSNICNDQISIASANAVFLAKTLSLSRQLSLTERIKLLRKLSDDAQSLPIDPRSINDLLLRTIVTRRSYRYAVACSILLNLKIANE